MSKIAAHLTEEIIIGKCGVLVVDGTLSGIALKAKLALHTASAAHIEIATEINDCSLPTHDNNVCLTASYQLISFPRKKEFE